MNHYRISTRTRKVPVCHAQTVITALRSSGYFLLVVFGASPEALLELTIFSTIIRRQTSQGKIWWYALIWNDWLYFVRSGSPRSLQWSGSGSASLRGESCKRSTLSPEKMVSLRCLTLCIEIKLFRRDKSFLIITLILLNQQICWLYWELFANRRNLEIMSYGIILY